MNKSKLNYWIDVGLALSFFVCFYTGLVKWPGLINVIGVSAYKILHFSNISKLHDMSGLIMGLLVIIHLALHWKWIVIMTKNLIIKKKIEELQQLWNKILI